ncbi:MAG TPA: sulfotransferase domain-containing protein [Gemmatimonadota bacterium]|nr:sulfotransferase domain-containing protein [Gemmatimonadota bacterium]
MSAAPSRRTRSAPYLIVGGTTKAATTSLFYYLGEHPGVCAASMKEPRFFLDAEDPVRSRHRLGPDPLERYEEYFGHCPEGAMRLEATPSYLHSPGAPGRVAGSLDDVRVVFALREPISRLLSWFRFAMQDGKLDRDCSFPTYVRRQFEEDRGAGRPQHLRALEQGHYAAYVEAWIAALGRDRVHIVFFEAIRRDSAAVVAEILGFAGLDPDLLPPLEYEVHNPTRSARFPGIHGMYKRFRYLVRQHSHSRPRVQAVLSWARVRFEPLYWALNRTEVPEPEMPDHLHAELVAYYRPSVVRLGALPGLDLPEEWRRTYDL